LAVACLLGTRPADACGGGGVTYATGSSVVADAQRVVLALHDAGMDTERTDIVAQVGVPAAGAEYGVLIPVPGEPTIDPEPVRLSDLEELDRVTAPKITIETALDDGDEGGGCGCGSDGDDDSGGGTTPTEGSIDVSAPVNLGPATVVVIKSDDPDALNAWLDENGFAIPDEQQSLVDSYVAAGDSFIALKRSDDAPADGPSSLGLHYTLAGDHRQLSLAFARLGAAPRVSFTVFVAAPSFVTPDATFTTLDLADLNASLLRQSYSKAVASAVADAGSHAFVLENTEYPPLSGEFTHAFRVLLGVAGTPYNFLTRATTVVAATALDADVRFDGPSHSVRGERTVHLGETRTQLRRGASVGLLALVFAARALRRRRAIAAR
jgi:hypothetical protein